MVFAIGVSLAIAGADASSARLAVHKAKMGAGHPKGARKTKPQRHRGGILASGLVIGSGVLVGEAAHSPEPKYLHNVSINPGIAGSPKGAYCLALATGISSFGAVVTVSPSDLPYPASETALPYVTWLSHAPDCVNKQLEIRTFTYTVKGGVLNMTPSNDVSFSFIVSG